MRPPDPPPSPKAREAAAVSHVVELIRTKVSEARVLSENDLFPEQEFGDEFETALRVRTVVNFLQDVFAIFDQKSPWGNRSENKISLAAISTHLSALRDLLVNLPGGLRTLLFPPWYRDVDLLARLADAEPARRQCLELIESLTELADRVGIVRDQNPGERNNANFPHRITAFCSAEILKHYGLKPTRGNDAKRSLFEEVASSLFEAATGEADDLIRACRDIIDGKFVL